MFLKSRLSKYLLVSALGHVLIALAMSGIYAEQPKRQRLLKIVSAVKIQYKEPEPPPKPKKVVATAQPKKKVAPKKKVQPVVKEIEPPKVTQQKRYSRAPAPGLAAEKAPQRSRSAPGVAGFRGTRGSEGVQPGMRAAGGVSHPTLTTKIGGPGLSPGQMSGSMEMPAGTGRLPGKGGKGVAGFRMGTSQAPGGVGRVDIPGDSGSGGRSTEGPGTGVSTVTGRISLGDGKGTAGLGVGTTDGMGEVESEPGGGKPGGGGGGPGMGGHQASESRSGPGLTTGARAETRSGGDAPPRKDLPENRDDEAIKKERFKTDLEKNMAGVAPTLDEPANTGFGDALQGEINKELYSLRKMYEDWQNLKLPNIPRALQITVELGAEKGKPKLLKMTFHGSSLAPRIKDDLTKKIRTWKFESLHDGKNDPERWPVKLTGKISWQ